MRVSATTGLPRRWLVALAIFAALLLSACGSTSLPSGVYASQQYHFSVSYPAGWQVNSSPQPSATAPLILVITRTGSTALPGSQISSLTINILDMSNPGIAQNANSMKANKSLTRTTVGGQPGYRDTPVSQPGAASGSSVTVIHSDYYVVHGAYFYTISTDALPGDSATLDQMAQSFRFLS
ncbi:MAG: hypothetical protein KGO05_04250 [Chloroflexota bacterium]|nr:hypothetical protein [Chloroflexota bacterium]